MIPADLSAKPLLSIKDLSVRVATRRGDVDAVKNINLTVAPGETLGIVGESGSGKSVTAYATTRLLDPSGRIVSGSISYRGRDITKATWKTLRSDYGASISMIFQSPRAALNPIRPVGAQIIDAILSRNRIPVSAARSRALDLLNDVRIHDPDQRFGAYPHELSGGMCQRVMIAIAIATEPDLLIADEPTTGLDVTTQKTVMNLLNDITARRGMAMMLITHDLGLAADYCGRVAVMERGRVVETAAPIDLFVRPRHAYTRRLVAASPTATSTVYDLTPAAERVDPGTLPPDPISRPRPRGSGPILEVRSVAKRFGKGVVAVKDISFSLKRGESIGIVGESGSGKSTLSRLICRLIDRTSGDIIYDGTEIGDTPAARFHASPFRRDIQLVFQDAQDSLNPRFTVFDCIAHPLRRLEKLRKASELRARVEACAAKCGLGVDLLDRFPHQLSGGQRARVGIARAIACNPRLLVLDEPTAALDVSVQAVILQLLDRLRREEDLSFLFVSHDLNVVRMMCQRIIVMREGEVVEIGESADLFAAPTTDYTRALVAAIPRLPSLATSAEPVA
jgi:peptide/nickel transport system ATP-binding protein